MHPIKNLVTGKEEDLTAKFQSSLLALKKAATEAHRLAENACPYAAEAKMSEIQTHLREAVQIVTTASNYFQDAIPDTPWKKEHIEKCYQ